VGSPPHLLDCPLKLDKTVDSDKTG
jgi:hypothetical protein